MYYDGSGGLVTDYSPSLMYLGLESFIRMIIADPNPLMLHMIIIIIYSISIYLNHYYVGTRFQPVVPLLSHDVTKM